MAEEVVETSFMDPFKDILVNYLMPEKCYDEFFLQFNLLHGRFTFYPFSSNV